MMRFVYSSDLQQSYLKVRVNFVLEDVQQTQFLSRELLLHFTPWSCFSLGRVYLSDPSGSASLLALRSGAIQQRFIMVHKHTRPGRRKASTSFYFCLHVKSVKGQPLLFGLTPLTRITFFVTRTNSCVWCSCRRW